MAGRQDGGWEVSFQGHDELTVGLDEGLSLSSPLARSLSLGSARTMIGDVTSSVAL